MLFWRIWAILLGSSLMIGELIRSWGQGRHPLFILDDFFIGVPLVVMALLMASPTPKTIMARRCLFSASFAAAAGMLYGSFFGKLVDATNAAAATTNIEIGFLTALIGAAFVSSLIGLVGSVVVKDPRMQA